MQVAARSYLATGVALVGAGAIAVSPVAPPVPDLPDITVPAISSAAVDLSALGNPITVWADVIAAAIENSASLGGAILDDPAPILRQIFANQLGYAETLVGAGRDVIEAVVSYYTPGNPTGLSGELERVFDQLEAGDIATAFATLAEALVLAPILGAGIPLLLSGALDIPKAIAQNFADAVAALTNPANALGLITGGVGPIMGAINAFGGTAQEVADAVGEGELVAAATALINLPAVLTGAVLNGYENEAGTFFPGLLSFDPSQFSLNGGILQAVLVNIPRAIAAALGATTATATAKVATDEVSSTSTEPASIVTMDITDAAAKTTAPAGEGAGTDSGGGAPTDPAPVSDGAADEQPAEEPADEAPTGDETPAEDPADEAPAEDAAEDTAEEAPAEEDSTEGDEGEESGDESNDDEQAGDDNDGADTDNGGNDNAGNDNEGAVA
ncbi:hypothetical protein E4P42_22570 [Mycobacterium sp. PS03-16]|uniref:hypothetical protein n=1 Tax=Mycobacterium sp. PS03-16 TaxID=2559611 RepID=UPI0010749406|nr:hypothetical protein [Mycobacterium sp. PS03-16]TFV55511.1 hypothetical protein E4P42_22570 [Mycobacterium sp. PS03-16]